MDRTMVARWRDWSGDGVQHVVVGMRSDRIIAEGAVIASAERTPFAATYRVECNPAWRVTAVRARVIGVDDRGVDLTSDGAGHWRDDRGVPLRQFDGSIDVDISVTPFTNTLPIRRLDLAEGQSADIRAVYIRLPDLTLTVDPQRYTCLKRGQRYRYESLDSDFVREIDVDVDGLVVTYPGLFSRVLPIQPQ